MCTAPIFLVVYILFYITYEQKARRGDDDVSLEEFTLLVLYLLASGFE